MAKTLDGLTLAAQIKLEIAAEVKKLAKTPGLGTILEMIPHQKRM